MKSLHNWLKTNHFIRSNYKLIEQSSYFGGTPREGGGGEYPLQDGFGWTIGGAPPDWPLRRAQPARPQCEPHHKWLTEFQPLLSALGQPDAQSACSVSELLARHNSRNGAKTLANRF